MRTTARVLSCLLGLAACGGDDDAPRTDAAVRDAPAEGAPGSDAGDGADGAMAPVDGGAPRPPPAPRSCAADAPVSAGWHVSPTGRSDGDGSAERPWDVATAFAPAPAIGPGDTVWLHGGVYPGATVSKLEGTAESPVVVRSYPGEWAVLDGAGSADTTFQAYRGHTVYRDLEIRNSTPHARQGRASGTWLEGPGIRLVHLVIHDTGNVAMYEEAPDLEVYGCLVYHVGFDDPDPAVRSHGHNLYLQNDTGRKLIAENLIFHGYSFGAHAYQEGTSTLHGLVFEGNVFWGAGYAAPDTGDGLKDNLLVGGADLPASGIVLRENLGWARPLDERSVSLGYGVDNDDVLLEGNYLVGHTWFRRPWASVTMTGNTFVGPVDGAVEPASFPDNTYLDGAPTETRVFVRPSRWQPGRAHVVVYNWAGLDTVTVDVSAVLAPGTPFEVRRAMDFFGAPVLEGLYAGEPLSLPITGAPVAQPVGAPGAIDPAEMPGRDFEVFVLLPRCP